jgi:hypothetical protein
LQGHRHDTLNAFVPAEDDLHRVDEHFCLPKGTTYKTMCLLGEPSLLNEKLAALGIQLGDWGILPKEQRPQWQALMKQLDIGTQYWKDPDLLLVKPIRKAGFVRRCFGTSMSHRQSCS